MNKRKIIISVLIGSIVVIGGSLYANTLSKNKDYKTNNTQITKKHNENQEATQKLNESKEDKNLINNNEKLEDGEFFGEGRGYAGLIKVKVTVKNGSISRIGVLSHSETPSFYEKGKNILERIINKNSVDVDSVSGATLTSNGIKEAVRNALKDHGLKNKDIKIEKSSNIKDKNQKVIENKNEKIINNKNKFSLNNIVKTEGKTLKDGEYYGIGKGFNGSIKVRTIIKNGKINDVQVLSYNDDLDYINKAKKVITNILGRQNTYNVDNVSGATYSSKGILEAINQSISKAIVNPSNIKKSYIVKDIKDKKDKKAINNVKDIKDKTINQVNRDVNNKKQGDIKGYKPVNTSNFNINDGEYSGRGVGFYTNRSILSRVIFKDNAIKEIILAEGYDNNDYGDDRNFKETAKGVLRYLYKDRDKTINDLMEYEFIKNNILNVAYEKDIDKCITEGKKYLGNYAEKLKNIDLTAFKGHIESQIKKVIKEYFKQDNRGEVLDAVSGGTYSAIGITKSVNAAIHNAKEAFQSKKYIKNVNMILEKVILYKDELNNEQTEKLSIRIEYSDNTNEVVKYKDFKKKGIKLINAKTKEEILSLKDLYSGEYFINIKDFQYPRTFYIEVLEKTKDDIIGMEYSLDDGMWIPVGNLDKDGESIKTAQTFNIDRNNLGKRLKIRVKTRDGRSYYLTDSVLLNKELKIKSFEAKREDVRENSNLGWGYYKITFVNKIIEVEPRIEANNRSILTWKVKQFDPMFNVKAISANGHDLTSKIKITKNTLKDIPGTYEIEYSVTDNKGINSTKSINVYVVNEEDDD
ncbi:FMN-binding protein [Clostridium botulinum]|uniref:FMN-binding protein n=1 Tax=Clostridium botulinum TaxID=1491 RepID=UPI00052DFCB4|nr:FMN-binding protein [Clostridium botulinum]KGM95936.1 hypothetical protein Z956_03705 [Clostridium botulinum D str. CCUG 7971]NFO98834.1 FMN-binding protein [Clostridium botulinum]OOV52627.1 FMN-binding domain-containing protein [Clostridium botulinum D/C]OOV53271.1 FMN-binding domain-containing protein [Clostridium botulinum D/C]OOV53547.1 FMN-binding domain-containing protein [Clostridium botulinum D/C]